MQTDLFSYFDSHTINGEIDRETVITCTEWIHFIQTICVEFQELEVVKWGSMQSRKAYLER